MKHINIDSRFDSVIEEKQISKSNGVPRPTSRLQRLGDELLCKVIEKRQILKEKRQDQQKIWARNPQH